MYLKRGLIYVEQAQGRVRQMYVKGIRIREKYKFLEYEFEVD